MKFFLSLFCLVVLCSACSTTNVPISSFLGTSVSHLREVEGDAVVLNFSCQIADCYERLYDFVNETSSFKLYQANADEFYFVVYDLPQQIDSTEVGIFLYPESTGTTVRISSLSRSAKRKVAEIIRRNNVY